MVPGLDLFSAHFRDFSNRYVVIGGVACYLVMKDAGIDFRATKDLDIVLCIEALDRGFAQAFWSFVQAGKYQIQETSDGRRKFYRFINPENKQYPVMLELFSRRPDILSIPEGSVLTPIPIEEEISSLSAILLDDVYYAWIVGGKKYIEGVTVLAPEHIVPLKARAWMDLTARKASGEQIDSRAVRKHLLDVFRLFQVVDPEAITKNLPEAIREDMRSFVEKASFEIIDLKNLGLGSTSQEEILQMLSRMYVTES